MKRGVDHIGVTVCFYCHDKQGRMLLQKRSQNCRDERGHWDCGGGSMEFGETFEEAVRRELKEEYDTEPLEITFCGVENVLRTHNNQKTHWIALIFSVLLDPKTVKIGEPDSIDEIGWFTEKTLPAPLHSAYLNHLRVVQAKK